MLRINMRILFLIYLFSNLLNAQQLVRKPTHVPGELLVAPIAGASRSEIKAAYEAHGAQLVRIIDRIDVHQIRVPEHALEVVENALQKNPKIKYVEKNPIGELAQVPNDPYYIYQWHHNLISSPTAWDMTTGSNAAPIAILDAGFDTNNLDIASKFVSGYNAVNGGTDFRGTPGTSCWSHGTFVASVAAGLGNDSLGAAGVAWQNPIIPILVFDSNCSLQLSYAAAGVIAATDRGAKIINMSFIFYWSPPPQTFIDAVKYALNKGVVVIAAAGNDNQIYAQDSNGGVYPSYPQTITNVITVAATDQNDVRTSWSNFGPYIAVSAPGYSVNSSGINGARVSLLGTSFSSPIVAGVAALALSVNPELSNLQINDIIKSSSDDLGAVGWDQYYGHGRVNASRAVAMASVTTPVANVDLTAPNVQITSPSSGSKLSDSVTVSVSASDNVGVTRVDFYANGTILGTDTTSPYSISLNTTAFPDGSLTIQARAYDAANNVGQSSSVTVSIQNTITIIVAPSLVSIIPNQVRVGQSVDATISGSGIKAGAKVTFTGNSGGVPSVRILSISADGKSMRVRITGKSSGKTAKSSKTWDVNVTNVDGGTSRLFQSFTVLP